MCSIYVALINLNLKPNTIHLDFNLDPKYRLANATHPAIMAYRIATPRAGVYLQDCDDDGEAAAGGRLLHLLQLARAEDVVVVVSRWFGGVLLGPSRFGLINNCARELLVKTGFIEGGGGGGAGSGGKKKGGKGGR